jgi:hypothetical protein
LRKILTQQQTVPRIAASCIELYWNSAQRADKPGLRGLTMNTQQMAPMPDRRYKVLLGPTVVALWFLDSYAFRYLTVDRDRFGIYWLHREWLYVHIIAGMLALFLGPVLFWLGLNRQAKLLHRILGGGYVLSVFVSGSAAFYLARHTDFGWVFGMGLTTMAVAWIISTTFATIAAWRLLIEQRREWMIGALSACAPDDLSGHLRQQHREWMTRSYVLTFGFVTFRILTQSLQLAGVGTTLEQMTAASWFSWSVPLLITEWLIQGRKILISPAQMRRDGAIASGLARLDGADQQIDFVEQHHPTEVEPRVPILN